MTSSQSTLRLFHSLRGMRFQRAPCKGVAPLIGVLDEKTIDIIFVFSNCSKCGSGC